MGQPMRELRRTQRRRLTRASEGGLYGPALGDHRAGSTEPTLARFRAAGLNIVRLQMILGLETI